MAITVLTNAMLLVNGVDLSNHVSKLTIEDLRDQVDVTAMGVLGDILRIAGERRPR